VTSAKIAKIFIEVWLYYTFLFLVGLFVLNRQNTPQRCWVHPSQHNRDKMHLSRRIFCFVMIMYGVSNMSVSWLLHTYYAPVNLQRHVIYLLVASCPQVFIQ